MTIRLPPRCTPPRSRATSLAARDDDEREDDAKWDANALGQRGRVRVQARQTPSRGTQSDFAPDRSVNALLHAVADDDGRNASVADRARGTCCSSGGGGTCVPYVRVEWFDERGDTDAERTRTRRADVDADVGKRQNAGK